MGQGIDTRQQTYCLSLKKWKTFWFTTVFAVIQIVSYKYCLSCFFFISFHLDLLWQAKRWKDKWIECMDMHERCLWIFCLLLSEYVLITWLIFCAMMMTLWNCDAIHEEALTLWMWLLTTLNINIVVCAMLCCSSCVEVVEVLRVFCKMSWNSECVWHVGRGVLY